MTKRDAISLFGSVSKLAAELGVTPQAISLWSEGELPKRRANEVLGAAVRAGIWSSEATADKASTAWPGSMVSLESDYE